MEKEEIKELVDELVYRLNISEVKDMLKAGKLELLKWNERELLRQIEREKAKRQDGLTEYYIKEFTKC